MKNQDDRNAEAFVARLGGKIGPSASEELVRWLNSPAPKREDAKIRPGREERTLADEYGKAKGRKRS
jgi:hypothetical protein